MAKKPKSKSKPCAMCGYGRGTQCCGRGGAPVMARGLGGDILGGLGNKFLGGAGGHLGRGIGDAIGSIFGFKKGGRIPGQSHSAF